MFRFPWFAPPTLWIQVGVLPHDGQGVSPFGHFRLNGWLAPPRNFSQPPTSFIASEHLGIHRTPLVACLPRSLCPAPGQPPFPDAAGWHESLEPKAQAPMDVQSIRFRGPAPVLSCMTAPSGGFSLVFTTCEIEGFHAFQLLVSSFPSYALVNERPARLHFRSAMRGLRVRAGQISKASFRPSRWR